MTTMIFGRRWRNYKYQLSHLPSQSDATTGRRGGLTTDGRGRGRAEPVILLWRLSIEELLSGMATAKEGIGRSVHVVF